jgi:hypothetical protein
MNTTAQQVQNLINNIETAVRHGLETSTIQAVMKDQKRALVSDRHALRTTLTHCRKNYLLGNGRFWPTTSKKYSMPIHSYGHSSSHGQNQTSQGMKTL